MKIFMVNNNILIYLFGHLEPCKPDLQFEDYRKSSCFLGVPGFCPFIVLFISFLPWILICGLIYSKAIHQMLTFMVFTPFFQFVSSIHSEVPLIS